MIPAVATDSKSATKVTTVLIVDDLQLIRIGISTILSGDPAIQIVGEAKDGLEALEQATRLQPDVVLMDIEMPNLNGIEATRRLKILHPETRVVMLTIHIEDTYVVEAVRAGAVGYVLKDASKELICETIKLANAGHLLIKSEMLRQALTGLANLAAHASVSSAALSEREMEVLKLVTEGHTNRQIGSKLFIAEVTVKKHIQSIIAKLGALDRTHAAVKALRAGLVN